MITRYFICLQGYQPCRERRAGNGASELLTKISAIRGNPLNFYFVSLSNNPIKTVQWVYSDRQRSPFVAVEIPINKIIGRGTRFSVGEHHNSPNCRINSWIDKDALFKLFSDSGIDKYNRNANLFNIFAKREKENLPRYQTSVWYFLDFPTDNRLIFNLQSVLQK